VQAPAIDKNQYPILSRLAAAGWEYPEKRGTE
jgi:hypothetical protein